MTSSPAKSFEEYLAQLNEPAKSMMKELHDLIVSAVSDIEETMKWHQPAIVEPDGMILLVFSGFKDHMNLVVTPSTLQAFANELASYETAKGAIHFSYDQPLPAVLIKKIVAYRQNEYRQRGVKWK